MLKLKISGRHRARTLPGSTSSSQQSYAMRFAVCDVDQASLVDEHAMRTIEFALQRIRFRSVAALARSQHCRDHGATQVDAPDGVALRVGDVDAAVSRPGDAFRSGELGLLGRTAVACV